MAGRPAPRRARSVTDYLIQRPAQPRARLLLAHGAGAPMDSDFMNQMAERLCAQQLEVVRFEFPYMAERRSTGKRRPPAPIARIVEHFEAVRDHWRGRDGLPLWLGGKSMGGRAAAMLSDGAAGVVVLGYPLHPAGKPDKLRLAPLMAERPMLILQGERDPLGNRADFEALRLPRCLQLRWLADGDHDLKPRRASGHTHGEHLATAARTIAEFITR